MTSLTRSDVIPANGPATDFSTERALVPFMGYYGWPFTVPENICDIKDIPVWAFHGDADEVIPLEAEQSIVEALKACGGDVQFTIFPDLGHDMDPSLIYNPELYAWLLSHARNTQ